jgi:ubiquitin C-terminal hydrolase
MCYLQIIALNQRKEREESSPRYKEVTFWMHLMQALHVNFNVPLERDGQFILGLVNTQNYCFVNSVLQVKKKKSFFFYY